MPDELVQIGRSTIQHGPQSDRVYAMSLSQRDMPDILDELDELAAREEYGKVIAKGRRSDFGEFFSRGYQPEAVIPDFFGPGEDAVFMGKFLDPERTIQSDPRRIREVLQVARRGQLSGNGDAVPEAREDRQAVSFPHEDARGWVAPPMKLDLREATATEVEVIAACYDAVFETYPFPIHDPAHLRREMGAGTRYFAVWEAGVPVAASAMEPGGTPGSVEMTDFATLPSHRGRGFASRLLALMDEAAERAGTRIAFTIARAVSFGMNITFARRGYSFAGTLVNHTQIGGSIESMNIWYKALREG